MDGRTQDEIEEALRVKPRVDCTYALGYNPRAQLTLEWMSWLLESELDEETALAVIPDQALDSDAYAEVWKLCTPSVSVMQF
jgi:hypothetical protein